MDIQRVWILGAGYSAPLGGPLLKQLFTPASLQYVRAVFPKLNFPEMHSEAVTSALNIYLKGSPGRQFTGHIWADPEEFLDFVETAALPDSIEGEPSRKNNFLQSFMSEEQQMILQKSRFELATAARCLLAAECSAFLVGADVRSEKWQAHREWAGKLSHSDLVVNFNYDGVFYLLKNHGVPLEVLLPGVRPESSDRAQVLHLHGNVNWSRNHHGGGAHYRYEQDFATLKANYDEMGIAPPGPNKATHIKDLDSFWKTAEERIATADEVYFVGYRFPPTDTIAKQRLIRAFRGARNDPDKFQVKIILGPDESDADIRRLKAMIESIVRPSLNKNWEASVVPMWSQDFLALY
jgi:hypothetical protein